MHFCSFQTKGRANQRGVLFQKIECLFRKLADMRIVNMATFGSIFFSSDHLVVIALFHIQDDFRQRVFLVKIRDLVHAIGTFGSSPTITACVLLGEAVTVFDSQRPVAFVVVCLTDLNVNGLLALDTTSMTPLRTLGLDLAHEQQSSENTRENRKRDHF
jgi:hypothetical protein